MGGTSQKQIEANRRNAAKSTGPRTEEGRRRSRLNGLRHGMAAEVVVPEEERREYEGAVERWEREAGPDNAVEEQLIRRAAVASVKLTRIERAIEEARQQAAREAVGCWERRMRARARKVGQRLMLDPVGAVEELEASAFGCEWMARRWRALGAMLRQGRAWGRGEVQAAQALLGLPVMVPGPCGEPASRRLWGLAARSNPTGVEEPPPSPTGDQDGWPRHPGEAWEALRDFVKGQVDRLIGLRDEAWEEVEGPECAAIARLAAAADVSKEGQLRHRYEASADRACNAAIRLFLNLRDRRRKELLAIAKEAAEIGDTPKAPVGGGWWREVESDPAPPGFSRVEPVPAETVPMAVAASDGLATPPSPDDPAPPARPGASDPAPTAAIVASTTRLPAPPPDGKAPRSSPDATRRSEPISAPGSSGIPTRKPFSGKRFGIDRRGRGRGVDRRTDPSPTPSSSSPNPRAVPGQADSATRDGDPTMARPGGRPGSP